MTPPIPLVVWSLSLLSLGVGVRRRRAPTRHRSSGLPRVIRIVGALPVPDAVARRGGGERLRRAGRGANLMDSEIARLARARAAMAGVALVCGGILALAQPIGLVVGALAAGAGWLAPTIWIAGRARARRARIVRDLPDLIDLVVICAESGLALDPAVRVAVAHLDGPLVDELERTVLYLDLGTPRREAYRALADRVDAPELTGLVGALLQAEELGVPIAAALRRHAELMRAARRQDIRDLATRAAPKVQLVVAMIMVPAALLLVVGTLMIELIGRLGGVAGGLT